MYHVIGDPAAGHSYEELFVSPADFEAQMTWLAARGYAGVTLRQVYDYWFYGTPLPARPIVVSFDDGYLGQDTNAVPVLRRLHWPGVLNLKLNALKSRYALPAWRVRDMLRAGWELDAHTITHPDLTRLDDAEIWHQVYDGRVQLQLQFRAPVEFFCYPAGKYDAHVVNAVQLAGYLGATGIAYGVGKPQDVWTLNRIRIDRSDHLSGFAAKLQSLVP